MSANVNNKYLQLKARLVVRGTNIRRWATEKNYPISTTYDAAKGARNGIESVKIRRELEEFAYAK